MIASLPTHVEDVLTMSIADYRENECTVAIIGFDPTERRAIEYSTVAAGGRVLTYDSEHLPSADLLLIDAINATDLDAPPDIRADQRLIVRASLATVDTIEARWPNADIVIGADPVELHLTLGMALNRPVGSPAAIFDVASEEGLRLQRLADEIGRIARTLVDLPNGLNSSARTGAGLAMSLRGAAGTDVESDGGTISAAEVRAIIRLRRMRDRYFPGELFADPAWDMLLDLAAARIDRTRVAVSSLCIAAAVPPTTALRWIKAMTDKGLLRRIADPHDARRIFIQLSDDAAVAMDKYLRAAKVSAALPV
jgi:DNA-binding MarR family transcriptional regulator